MSPPLETTNTNHEKSSSSTGSLGVDTELNLLSSPKNSAENDQQAMDLFLNQVAEYNAQQLSFDQQHASSSSSHTHTMGMDPAQVLAQQQQQQQQEVKVKHETVEFTKPEPPATSTAATKKGKQKQKDNNSGGGHSSLLHVFTNPLLHAIPILARNMLNFEDFLAQTSLPGQSLLGPGEIDLDQPDNDFMSPPVSKSDSPWHIRVLGLPHTGAKSRVETQIKICLQLVDTAGELATNWSHIKLPEHLVAKDKLKRKNQAANGGQQQQKYQAQAEDKSSSLTSVTDHNQVLILEAAVVCDGQPDNEIIMCTSCVHRERKRLKRKRDNKVARAANKEGGAAKLAALFANDLPDLSDENIMAEERRRILLFNCNEYVEFNNGEATLPTRVTCYCRHHSEKTGFRVVFTVKDHLNHVIATGRSPPIMITDDHKSSKMQQTAARKRTRAEMDQSESDVPTPSTHKRKNNIQNQEMETDSGVSSPIASTPATPSSQIIDLDNNIPDSNDNDSTPTTVNTTSTNNNNTPTNNNQYNIQQQQQQSEKQQHPLAADNDGHFISQLTQQYNTTTTNNNNNTNNNNMGVSQGELFDFLTSTDLSMLPTTATNQHQQHHQQQQYNHNLVNALSAHMTHQPLQQQQQQQQQQALSLMHPDHQQQQILNQFTMNGALHNMNNRRRATVIGTNTNTPTASTASIPNNNMSCQQQSQWQGNNNVYAKLQERNALDKTPNLPRLHRLIPSEGPIYGGAEVTVLGSNFYEGLTCLFGENPAIPTHCWSANTLLCILPPAATAGPVVVSFKEHPLMLEGQDVVLFTYFDESDRALMELALQVVGLKTMGKVEDARQIAMRIVQGDSNKQDPSSSGTTVNGNYKKNSTNTFRYKLTPLAATAVYDNARKLFLSNLEQQIMSTLLAVNRLSSNKEGFSLTNRNQHSLLHLATICGHVKLVQQLVQELKCNVDQKDKNGFTALHFASWSGKLDIVQILIHITNLKITNRVGKTAERLAIEAGHKHIVQLFKEKRRKELLQQKKKAVVTTTRIPLTDFIPTNVVNTIATHILPTKIQNLLSDLYTFSTRTKYAQRVTHSAGQVYNFMLDPF